MTHLNLGAGEPWSHAPPPWVDVDVRAETNPDVVADVRRLPWPAGAVEAIYAGHVLEHLPLAEVGVALAEWLRVLAPGGEICVVGPDVEKAAVLFAAGAISQERFEADGLHSTEAALAEARRSYGAHADHLEPTSPAFHQWECSGRAVAALLEEAGFADVREVPIAEAPGAEAFPIYDRTMADQFVVLARRAPAPARRIHRRSAPPPRGRVHFLASPANGGFHLRAAWPAEALEARGWSTQVTLAHLFHVEPGDVVIVHRPMAPSLLEAVHAFTDAGVPVIVDTDDELEQIPAENDWQATPEILARHRKAIRLAAGLTVSSDRLAAVYGLWARRTFVVRNHLPAWVSKVRSGPVGDGRVRVGWAGTTSVHRQDLTWLAPVMPALLDGALLTTVGDFAAARYLGLLDPGERFGWEPDLPSYYRKMARADIGLVPLDVERCWRFNSSKSSLKAQEYLALGIPVVAADLPEQRRVIVHGVTGFLAASPEAFAMHVQRLVRDPALRARMGEAAAEAGRALAIEHHVGAWEAAIEGVVHAGAPARAGQPANRKGDRRRAVAPRAAVRATEER